MGIARSRLEKSFPQGRAQDRVGTGTFMVLVLARVRAGGAEWHRKLGCGEGQDRVGQKEGEVDGKVRSPEA